jgi:hypothetical protein
MGRRRQREVERAGGRADEPRNGHRDDVTKNQFGQGTGHRLLRALLGNGDHRIGE